VQKINKLKRKNSLNLLFLLSAICLSAFNNLLLHSLKKIGLNMPKMKTHSRAKKTFKVTGNGGIKFRKSGRGHLLTKKSTKRKRHMRIAGMVNDTQKSMVRRLLCI
jgi:large subunit ribosomal protein L35